MLSVISVGLGEIVGIVVFLLICGAVLGLLYYLINLAESTFGGPPLFFKVVRFAFIVLVVLLMIGLLLHLAGVPFINIHA